MPPRARSVAHLKIAVDGTNILGGLCGFGTSIELVKKVSEIIFLNLTFHSFGPEISYQ
jgi:hypothetical protein